MPIFLNFDDPTFVQRFEDLLNSDRNDNLDVNRVVIDILTDVKTRGDEAILELTHRFDKIELDKEKLRFTKNEIEEISSTISLDERKALDLAATRIRVYHEKQKPEDVSWFDQHLGMDNPRFIDFFSKFADIFCCWMKHDFIRRVALFNRTIFHNCNAVRQAQRLIKIMRYKNNCLAQNLLQT